MSLLGRWCKETMILTAIILCGPFVLDCDGSICSKAAMKSCAWAVAKRMECVELAPAIGCPRASKAGASSTHSIRFARFGFGFAALWLVCYLPLLAAGAAVAPIAANDSTNQTVASTNWQAQFQIEKGFRIELVASEQLISSPAAMAFDENGRLFVAEMRDYPDQRERSPHLGRIRLLEDTDGDGLFDASTVYAEDIAWPSALACYDGGVF